MCKSEFLRLLQKKKKVVKGLGGLTVLTFFFITAFFEGKCKVLFRFYRKKL